MSVTVKAGESKYIDLPVGNVMTLAGDAAASAIAERYQDGVFKSKHALSSTSTTLGEYRELQQVRVTGFAGVVTVTTAEGGYATAAQGVLAASAVQPLNTTQLATLTTADITTLSTSNTSNLATDQISALVSTVNSLVSLANSGNI